MEILLAGDNLSSLNMVQVIDYMYEYWTEDTDAIAKSIRNIRNAESNYVEFVNSKDNSEKIKVSVNEDGSFKIEVSENK